MKARWISLGLLFLSHGTLASQDRVEGVKQTPEFDTVHNPRSHRTFFPAVFSFLLPGFGQYWEGQNTAGLAYTGVAVGGLAFAIASAGPSEDDEDDDNSGRVRFNDPGRWVGNQFSLAVDQKGVTERKVVLGALAYQGAGGMSSYHSFRTIARTRQLRGEYAFLRKEESPWDVLAAPARFDFLARPTTYLPLGIFAGVAALSVATFEETDDVKHSPLTSADVFFASAFSYNAGTHEEAMFRGAIMPYAREMTGSDVWSNAITSVLFAAAHLGTNPRPLPQLILGYYMGYVTQMNRWSIAEAVFIHTWWDVIAFLMAFSFVQDDQGWIYPKARRGLDSEARIMLPPFEWHF